MPGATKPVPTNSGAPWKVFTVNSPPIRGLAMQVPTGQGSQEQETAQSKPAQGSQQVTPSWGPATRPSTAQASSRKRSAIDKEDGPARPARRRKSEQGGEGSPTARTVGFRPANRTPPSDEDLELTRPPQKASSDPGGEEPEDDPSSSQATVSRRVSELRGAGRKRSSRSSPKRGESRLKSGLSKEWSMDS